MTKACLPFQQLAGMHPPPGLPAPPPRCHSLHCSAAARARAGQAYEGLLHSLNLLREIYRACAIPGYDCMILSVRHLHGNQALYPSFTIKHSTDLYPAACLCQQLNQVCHHCRRTAQAEVQARSPRPERILKAVECFDSEPAVKACFHGL